MLLKPTTIYVNADGNVLEQSRKTIYRYSDINEIRLVTPLAVEGGMRVNFLLSNGVAIEQKVMTPQLDKETVNGEEWNVWAYRPSNVITATVTAQSVATLQLSFTQVTVVEGKQFGNTFGTTTLSIAPTIEGPEPTLIDGNDLTYLEGEISDLFIALTTKVDENLSGYSNLTITEADESYVYVNYNGNPYKISLDSWREYFTGSIEAIRNRLNALEAEFTTALREDGENAFDQKLRTTDAVEFASVKLGANVVNESFVDVLEDKYTVENANNTFINKNQIGADGGVAPLDNTGRLPVNRLPIDTVVFRGTFGEGVGDLPTTGVETGDFYICVAADPTEGYDSVVSGLNFLVGDKAIWTGSSWSKIDNTETVTGVKGSEEEDFRIGNVTITKENIGLGNVTDDAQVTSVSGTAPISSTGGTTPTISITEASQSAAGSMSAADKTKLDGIATSANNYSHPNHSGDVTSVADGETTIATGAVTLAKMDNLTAGTIIGNDEEADGVPKALTASEARTLLDVYNKESVDTALGNKVDTLALGVTVATLESGKVPSNQLPSFVDDVLEFADLASFPVDGATPPDPTPETGKIYVALDNGKTYRWSGTQYTEISPSEVTAVNGYSGNVTLAGSDLAIEAEDIDIDASGFDGILTTDDTTLDVALTTIDGHTHGYNEITGKPTLYTQGEVNALLAEKADVSALSASITLYPTTSPSEVSGYFAMVTDITDVRYNDTAFDVQTGAISTQDQLVAELASDVNIFVGNPGVIDVTTLGNIRKVAGNSSQYAEFYYKVFQRKVDGTELLIATSETTGAINPDDNLYREFSAHALLNNGTFEATDRIVFKYYANALEGTVSGYEFQFGGVTPVRSFLPVPVRVLQSADKIIYDPSGATISATNLQDAVDELDALIQENTSVIKIQRFVITNADNGDSTFSYTYNGNARTGGFVAGQYRFNLEDSVQYILNQNRLEIKVNNDANFYSPDTEIEEIDLDTVGITYALQNGDEVFIKVYQGLDSVALVVEDGTITTAKLSTALQQDLTSYETHIGLTNNPHSVTAGQVGLGNLTNDTQVKKITSSTNGNVPIWDGTTGDLLADGYGVQTTLSSTTTDLVRADAIATAVGAKQDTLISGTNIKTINGSSILGSGDYEIDIPAVSVQATAPDLLTANVGDLWWNTTNAVLYIAYDDGSSKQWVEVSYADIQAEINALIGSAPDTLDTIQEIAAALQNNPDFYATLTGLIGSKASTELVGTKADKLATFDTVTADYTLVLDDKDKVLTCTNESAITITVPTNATQAFPVGSQIAVLANGAGTVTFAGASGVTVNSVDAKLAIKGQYSSAVVLKTGTDEWQLIGSLE